MDDKFQPGKNKKLEEKVITSESLRKDGYTLLEDITNPNDKVGVRIRNMDNGIAGKVLAYGPASEVFTKDMEIRNDDYNNYYRVSWDDGQENDIFQELTTASDHLVVIPQKPE